MFLYVSYKLISRIASFSSGCILNILIKSPRCLHNLCDWQGEALTEFVNSDKPIQNHK
jgi:hypothetical protein